MLNREYLISHADSARDGKDKDTSNYEQFGRQVAELLLRSAADNLSNEKDAANELHIDATVHLTAVSTTACVKTEICTPFGCVSAHVGI